MGHRRSHLIDTSWTNTVSEMTLIPTLATTLLLLLPTITSTVAAEDWARLLPQTNMTHPSITLEDATTHMLVTEDNSKVLAGRAVQGATTGGAVAENNTGVLKRLELRVSVFSDPALLHLLASTHPHKPPHQAHTFITTTISAVNLLPVPQRCVLLPPFLHVFIGCKSFSSGDHLPAPPSPAALLPKGPVRNAPTVFPPRRHSHHSHLALQISVPASLSTAAASPSSITTPKTPTSSSFLAISPSIISSSSVKISPGNNGSSRRTLPASHSLEAVTTALTDVAYPLIDHTIVMSSMQGDEHNVRDGVTETDVTEGNTFADRIEMEVTEKYYEGKSTNETAEKDIGGQQKMADEQDATISLRDFDVSGSGLQFNVPLRFLGSFFAPFFSRITEEKPQQHTRALRNTTTPSVTLDNTDAGGASLGQRDSPETGPIRAVFLRDASRLLPILVSNAPTHTRAFHTRPCTRTCGGGTRLVTQVCVEITKPDHQVDDALCDGLPNYQAPYNETCNTFPCLAPRWVSGAWSECSEWCGVGLQHRQVSCGMPLVRDAHPLTAGYLLDPASCGKHHQPREAQLCQGPCSHVDCSVKDNVLHPACYKLLQDSSLEKDHIDEPVLRGSSRT